MGLAITFGVQLVFGLRVILHPHNANAVDGVAVLVIVCLLIGIGRSWELIGGPSIVLRGELGTILRGERSEDDAPDARP